MKTILLDEMVVEFEREHPLDEMGVESRRRGEVRGPGRWRSGRRALRRGSEGKAS